MINDKNIAWNHGRQFIPARKFSSVTNIALTGGAMNKGVSNGSPDTDGGPLAGDYGATATECWGIDIAAAGDEVATYIPVGWNWDTGKGLEFRVWFVHQTADEDTPVWKVHLLSREAGAEALLPVLDNAGQTITFPAHTVAATADVVEVTDWSKALPGTVASDNFLGISVELDAVGSAGANEINLIGLEVGYTVKATTTDNARRIT